MTEACQDYEIRLSELGIEGACLAFEFWSKDMAKTEHGLLQVSLAPFTSRHYALHQDEGVPQVVGSDFHLSMGALELRDVYWNEKENVLSGTIERPANETGNIYVWVPERLDIDRIETAGARATSLGRVLAPEMGASLNPFRGN